QRVRRRRLRVPAARRDLRGAGRAAGAAPRPLKRVTTRATNATSSADERRGCAVLGGTMSGHRRTALIALATLSLGGSLSLAPTTFAADPLWNGQYILTLSANAKEGSSIAARQPEFAHRSSVSISSKCTSGTCIATVNDPPPPKNDSMPRTIEFKWNGLQWV